MATADHSQPFGAAYSAIDLCHAPRSAVIVYARVRAEQDRIRRDHRTAQERRQARQRARQGCEDLTELLGRMALPPRDPDQAADLLRRTRAAAHEIEGLVTGRRDQPRRRRRQRITPAVLHRLDVVVEELDEAVRDALDDESNTPDARSLALDLTAILLAGVEELCRVEQIA
jgi:hypothetical protein